MAGMGISSRANPSAGVSVGMVADVKAGTGATPQSIVRGFPGLSGVDQNFVVWLIFGSALVYMLGVHWTLGQARRLV